MTEDKLRIGVVGCGNISIGLPAQRPALPGRRDHRLRRHQPGRGDPPRRPSSICAALDVDALIADPAIDLVLNLTIPAAHFDVSMQALAAGKHVFTEKPLAVNADAGRRLVAEAAARAASRSARRPTPSSARPDGTPDG